MRSLGVLKEAAFGEGEGANTPFGRTLKNLENISSDMSNLVVENADLVNGIIQRAARATESLDSFLTSSGENGFQSNLD